MNFAQRVALHKSYFSSNATRDVQWRKHQLKQIKKLVCENEAAFISALKQDLGKPALETWMAEISYIAGEVDYVLKQINKWSKKRKVRTPIVAQPSRSFIQPEPQGTILIMGAWNYPIQLVLAPLIAIIAAGNCAVVKPSELSPATSSLLAKLVPLYLDKQAVSIIEGGIEETTELLKIQFDHIMYTGSGQVGRIVMTAATKHLTPTTLELGGKSPVYVDKSANLTISAQRIAWGKWMNAGQTCIAPDYILASKEIIPELVKAFKTQISNMFGKNPFNSADYGRMVNERHAQRVAGYLNTGEVVCGGEFDIEKKYIAPTVVIEPALDSKLMTEEIFGPIMPIVAVDSFEDAKAFINQRDKPLAAYIFTRKNSQSMQWIDEISSGSQCINDVILFNAVDELSIGGTGASGYGQYSGRIGFDNFSNLKSVIKRPFIRDLPVRFAPYTKLKFKLLRLIRHL